jgi:hypothetical protein
MEDHPKMGKSNGMRYDFRPGEAISIMLDPSIDRFLLKGTTYNGYQRVVRVWGRRRLELLRWVLPFADKVTVGVIGRGLPHYYICHCGLYRFTLLLSGWSRSDWATGSAFDLLAPSRAVDTEMTAAVYNYLVQHFAAPQDEIATHTVLPEPEVHQILFELCRAGRAIYDPVSRQYRLRELFAEPLDIENLFAPDPRLDKAQDKAQELFEGGKVTLLTAGPSELRKREMRATATVDDSEKALNVVLALDTEGQIRFGQCQCKFFADNIMSRGPCEHILATRLAFEPVIRTLEESAIRIN